MPTAFKNGFMTTAFNTHRIRPPWQVSPPATENTPISPYPSSLGQKLSS